MKARKHRGITLIELLVVVTILILLAAMVVPNLTPNIEARKLREAARGIDVFLASAKARAVANGRPVGVMITPAETNPYAALKLTLAEVPLVYAGDSVNSGVKMVITSQPSATNPMYQITATDSYGISIWKSISPGDLLQVGNKGYFYQIVATPANATTLSLRVNTQGGALPWPTTGSTTQISNPLPYKIYRQPVVYDSVFGVGTSSATAMAYQTPPGVAIDLMGSIFPGVNFASGFSAPRTILFSPTGGVDAIYANQGIRYLPSGAINLLVGKLSNIIGTPPGSINEPNANWYDLSNYYVSVGHLTGQITTTEIAPVTSGVSAPLAIKLQEATAFTRDNFASGGR